MIIRVASNVHILLNELKWKCYRRDSIIEHIRCCVWLNIHWKREVFLTFSLFFAFALRKFSHNALSHNVNEYDKIYKPHQAMHPFFSAFCQQIIFISISLLDPVSISLIAIMIDQATESAHFTACHSNCTRFAICDYYYTLAVDLI